MAAALPHTAHVLQHAPSALQCVGSALALTRYAEMAQREIVFDRIFGIEAPQCGRDLFGGGPARSAARGQPEVEPYAMNVRVDRNDELRGRNLPQTEVHTVGGADHPARVQKKTLARASGARIADQVAHVSANRVATKRIREASHRLPKIAVAPLVELRKPTTQGAVRAKQAARPGEHLGHVLVPIDAMDEALQQGAKLFPRRSFDRLRRRGAQREERALYAPPSGNGVSKSKARSNQAGDFSIARARVSMNDADWVSLACRLLVARGEQRIEPIASSVHFNRVLAILPSQPQ